MVLPPGPRSFMERLLGRGPETLVPSWEGTPYGELSEGLFWEAHFGWRRHRRLLRFWTSWYYSLGILGVVLAGLAGFGGLSEVLGRTQAALVAIASGIATGLATFL